MSGATVRRQSLRRTEQAFSFKGEGSDEEEEERGSDDTGSESSGGKRRTKHKKGTKKGKGHDKGGKTMTRRLSKESSMSSDEEGTQGQWTPGLTLSSNEAKRAGFATLKKKGESIRKSLSSKLLGDVGRFEKLERKWREADEEGSGFLDRDTFVDVVYIMLRQKARPSSSEMSWLCDQLKGKNKRVAYKECRAVLLGDYYDGSSYMPMWATSAMPYSPAPYMPHATSAATFLATQAMNPYATMAAMSMRQGMMMTQQQRQMSIDENGRRHPHAQDIQPVPHSTSRLSSSFVGAQFPSQPLAFSYDPPPMMTHTASLPINTIRIRAPYPDVNNHPEPSPMPWSARTGTSTQAELMSTHKTNTHKTKQHGKGGKEGRVSRGGHRGPSLHSSSPDKAFHLSHPHGGEERRAHGQHDQHKKGCVPTHEWPDSEASDDDHRWAALPGTVGEWLRYAASPLERRNFEELLTLLDEFSHDRGLSNRGAVGGEGVSVRLGSLLTAQITFHLAAT